MDNKIKHLEMIQRIIERMGTNSFQLKGWAVTLVSIIGALSAQGTDKKFFILSFIPLLAFWLIDAFYLQLERKYVELYKLVNKENGDIADFDMDIHNLSIKGTKMRYWRCLFSRTEACFYGSITIAVILLAIILKVW